MRILCSCLLTFSLSTIGPPLITLFFRDKMENVITRFHCTHFVEKLCLEELNLYALCNIFYIICFKFAYLKTNDSVLDYHWFTLHGVGSLFYNSSLGKLCTRKKTCIHNLNILILNCIFPTKH